MIAALTGKVLFIYPDKVVIDVSGVGYELFLSTDGLSRLPEIGNEVFLFVQTQVREDAITLYGFIEEEEKEMFLTLKSVSGIGPKLALSMLSGIRVGELCVAIGGQDVKRLTALQGIGKKTAERICVELKDKMGQFQAEVGGTSIRAGDDVVSAGSAVADAVSALVNLGYPDPVARQVLAKIKSRLGDTVFTELGVEELIREALRSFA